MSPFPPSRFPMVYFLYDGVNGKETTAVQSIVRAAFPYVHFMEPWVPPSLTKKEIEPWVTALRPFLLQNALLVGIGRAGLAAAYLQQEFPDLNLHVLAINAPTEWESGFAIERRQ